MEALLSLALGLGLSAACGFRIFVPLLVLGVGASSGRIELAAELEWLGSTPALVTLATATVLEVVAYYVPWLDNFLDTLASPAAVVAGTVVAAGVVTDIDPVLRWSLAAVAGGGAARVVQASTTLVRLGSSVTSGGLGNPIVATLELLGSIALSLAGLFLPLLAGVAVLLAAPVLVVLMLRVSRRRASVGTA